MGTILRIEILIPDDADLDSLRTTLLSLLKNAKNEGKVTSAKWTSEPTKTSLASGEV